MAESSLKFWLAREPDRGLWYWTLTTGGGTDVAVSARNYVSDVEARADIQRVQDTNRNTPIFERGEARPRVKR